MRAIYLFVLFIFSCASETKPYVSTRVVGDYHTSMFSSGEMKNVWFSDGPTIVIDVFNPTDKEVDVKLRCQINDPYDVKPFPIHLKPHGEFHALAQVMNKYTAFSPCWLDED